LEKKRGRGRRENWTQNRPVGVFFWVFSVFVWFSICFKFLFIFWVWFNCTWLNHVFQIWSRDYGVIPGSWINWPNPVRLWSKILHLLKKKNTFLSMSLMEIHWRCKIFLHDQLIKNYHFAMSY
jgi:hypothetical protein